MVLFVLWWWDCRQITTVGSPERQCLYLTTADSKAQITEVDTILCERPRRLSDFCSYRLGYCASACETKTNDRMTALWERYKWRGKKKKTWQGKYNIYIKSFWMNKQLSYLVFHEPASMQKKKKPLKKMFDWVQTGLHMSEPGQTFFHMSYIKH